MGVATPTEAAALGVVAALGLAYLNRKLTIEVLKNALIRTMKTICMVKFIVLTAFLLNFVMTSTGITQALVKSIVDLGLSPLGMILSICAGYIVLGCFLETMAMMIATVLQVVRINGKNQTKESTRCGGTASATWRDKNFLRLILAISLLWQTPKT
jgi:TRAP-type C4-dicarboxylate transport system permease large subunit